MLARVPWPFSLDPLIAEAHRRARRRRLLVFALVVVAAVAMFELRSASGSGVAAAGGRPVVHIVLEDQPSTVSFNLKTGRETVQTIGEKMWLDRQAEWHHIISTVGSRQVADQVWRSHYGPTTQAAAVDGFYAGLATDYRTALRSGAVELVGRGTFDRHQVDWLRVVPRRDQRWYALRELGEVGVDAHSYKPILLRGGEGKHHLYTRILLANALAFKAADFKSHGQRQPPGFRGQLAPGFASGSTNPSAAHNTAVRAPWLAAGTRVAGLELRAVKPFTIRRSKHHFGYGAHNPRPRQGLELVYGPASHEHASALPTRINLYGPQWEPAATSRLTTVYEVGQVPRVAPWGFVPAGSISVRRGLTTVGNRVVHTLSVAYLRERGLYITIRTPLGWRTALQIARSLHTVRR